MWLNILRQMAPALSDQSFTGKRAALIPGVGEGDDVLP